MSNNSLVMRNCQRSRWILTYNNYDQTMNYKVHCLKPQFNIKRAVLGFEVAPETGTHHIQGYVEFGRSVRECHVKRVFPTAWWNVASESSLINYRYCVKEGNFITIGDFSSEERGLEPRKNKSKRPASVSLIINGLLDPQLSPQVRVTKEYSDRYHYYDSISSYVSELALKNSLFSEWSRRRLYPWQYEVLKMIMRQPERQILWVFDPEGNSGKSFLSSYLNILYGFCQFDGVQSQRDIAFLITVPVRGFVFDVNREDAPSVKYGTLESAKNGYLMSGKYSGKITRFNVMPVVVFANSLPDCSKLSQDRWKLVTLGQGEFHCMEKTAVVSPNVDFPFIKPAEVPEISEKFSLRSFLQKKLPNYQDIVLSGSEGEEDASTTEENQSIGSLVPGIGNAEPPLRPSVATLCSPPSPIPSLLPRERQPGFSSRERVNQNPSTSAPANTIVSSLGSFEENQQRVSISRPMRPPICSIHPNQGKFYYVVT